MEATQNESDLLLNISVLYRNTQKFLEQKLNKYKLGSGQLIFLYVINENEGISPNQLARFCDIDKSTVTKSIQKLEEQGYITLEVDASDKRVRKIYTTTKANEFMSEFYKYRNEVYDKITNNLSVLAVEENIKKISENSKKLSISSKNHNALKIGFLQKLTLIDYPDKVACTVFLSGCNFKCPFCYNKDLVFIPETFAFYEKEKVLEYTKKRKGILEGVCITGGEPLIQESILDFIKDLKDQGYKVKLDTNGYYPEKLLYLIENQSIDYVAIDIKNCKERYAKTVGLLLEAVELENISKSIAYVMESNIDYEFRTTVVSEFHDEESFVQIGKWIKGAKVYYLQKYEENENVIKKGLTSPSIDEMKKFQTIVSKFVNHVVLREL